MSTLIEDPTLARFATVDVMEAISRRYSVREFKPEPVPDDVLLALLRAAHEAPSSWNLQPWEFIVVTDPAVKQELSTAVTPGNVPVVLNGGATFVCLGSMRQQDALADRIERNSLNGPDVTEERRQRVMRSLKPMREDVQFRREHVLTNTYIGMAQLVLAAQRFGLGSLWMGGFDKEKVKAVMGIPDDYLVASLITVGVPADTAVQKPRNRRPLEEIFWFNRYSGN